MQGKGGIFVSTDLHAMFICLFVCLDQDGGLYSKLYLCLYHMVAELTKLSETTSANQSSHESKIALQSV